MNGEVKRNSFSCPDHLLELVGDAFIDPIRDDTHFKLNRSNLIQTLFELALESKEHFNPTGVFDRSSFKAALRTAMADTQKRYAERETLYNTARAHAVAKKQNIAIA